jgi:hypothetical protein
MKAKAAVPKEVSEYLAKIGSKGGLRGTSETKRRAVNVRWAKYRAANSENKPNCNLTESSAKA